jgi:flagellar protein FlbD
MIALTRINRDPVVVNADLIVLIEEQPDTVLKLTTGEQLRVRESSSAVVERVAAWRRQLHCPAATESHLDTREDTP